MGRRVSAFHPTLSRRKSSPVHLHFNGGDWNVGNGCPRRRSDDRNHCERSEVLSASNSRSLRSLKSNRSFQSYGAPIGPPRSGPIRLHHVPSSPSTTARPRDLLPHSAGHVPARLSLLLRSGAEIHRVGGQRKAPRNRKRPA